MSQVADFSFPPTGSQAGNPGLPRRRDGTGDPGPPPLEGPPWSARSELTHVLIYIPSLERGVGRGGLTAVPSEIGCGHCSSSRRAVMLPTSRRLHPHVPHVVHSTEDRPQPTWPDPATRKPAASHSASNSQSVSSGAPRGQNYFHDNTKPLTAFFSLILS